MSFTILFGTIYKSYGTIFINFYLYLLLFTEFSIKNFNLNKINETKSDLKMSHL